MCLITHLNISSLFYNLFIRWFLKEKLWTAIVLSLCSDLLLIREVSDRTGESLCWFALLPVNFWQAASRAIIILVSSHSRLKSSFGTHRTARLTLTWDDGNIFPSIIAAAVLLTGARESELSESRLGIHTCSLGPRGSSRSESLSVASSWLRLLSSSSWLLFSLWISFFPALWHQLLIAGYWFFLPWLKLKKIKQKQI